MADGKEGASEEVRGVKRRWAYASPRVHELAKRAGAGRVKEGDEQVEHGPSGLDLAALAALSIILTAVIIHITGKSPACQ